VREGGKEGYAMNARTKKRGKGKKAVRGHRLGKTRHGLSTRFGEKPAGERKGTAKGNGAHLRRTNEQRGIPFNPLEKGPPGQRCIRSPGKDKHQVWLGDTAPQENANGDTPVCETGRKVSTSGGEVRRNHTARGPERHSRDAPALDCAGGAEREKELMSGA